MINEALKYESMGFSIIPVKQDKTPYVKWEKYQKEHPSKKEIRHWWTQWPDANIAIVTGERSRLLVIDADKRYFFEQDVVDYLWNRSQTQ